jgi:hypothetical protein
MPCHATHPIQDLFLESFSYELQFDMHFYMHSYLHKKNYSCKKWVLHQWCLVHNSKRHSAEECWEIKKLFVIPWF